MESAAGASMSYCPGDQVSGGSDSTFFMMRRPPLLPCPMPPPAPSSSSSSTRLQAKEREKKKKKNLLSKAEQREGRILLWIAVLVSILFFQLIRINRKEK